MFIIEPCVFSKFTMYCMSISTSTTNSLSDDSLGIVTTNASVHENNNA